MQRHAHRAENRGIGASRTPRALIALVIGALALVVAACGSGTSDTGSGGGTSGGGGDGETTTLKLSAITDNKPTWEDLIAKWSQQHPDIKIDANYAPTDQLQTSARAELAGGNAPDLITVWPGNGSAMSVAQLAPTGLLADISDADFVSQVPEGQKPLLGVNGKTYIWSPGVTPIGALYNKQLLKQVGGKIPKTWGELQTLCDKVKAAGKTCIALGLQTPWITQLIPYAIAPSTAFTQDPNLAQDMLDGKKSFENSGWGDVFNRYLDLEKAGYFNDNPNGTTFEQQVQMVASGKALMAVQVLATLPTFQAAAKDPKVIGTFVFPAADDPAKEKIAAGVGAGVAISAKTPNMDAAKQFVDFLGQPENIAAFSKQSYFIPMISSGESTQIDPLLKPFAPYVKENRSVPFMDQQWPNAKVQPAHFAGIQELFAGKTTVPGLLKTLDQVYQQK